MSASRPAPAPTSAVAPAADTSAHTSIPEVERRVSLEETRRSRFVVNARPRRAVNRGMSAARNLLDQTLDDRYRVRGELGRNDSGVLYTAEDIRDGGRITLQVLRPEIGQHAELRASFLEASLALTHAEHEHLIGVVGA